MNLDLRGKRALVTGSSSGIGEAIACSLAAEGARVIVHGRNEDRTARVADKIRGTGGSAEIALGDLSTDESATGVIRAVGAGGPIDILINNAGFYELTTWDTVTSRHWDDALQADLLSAVRLIQAFAPAMRERRWGRIIQIGSGSANQPFATQPQYCAIKAALLSMTLSLARALRGTGVTSNIVSPGLIRVEANQRFYRHMNETRRWGNTWDAIEAGVVRDVLPNDVGKMGSAEDVASVVCLLASPLSRFVSGANWRVDGGSTLGIQ
jgi:3-oxoacyl-[acyl-carrier protein] reductase